MKHIVPIVYNSIWAECEIESPDPYKCGDYEIEFIPVQTCSPGTVPESISEYKIVYDLVINTASLKSKEHIIQEVKEKYAEVIKNDEPYTTLLDMWDNTKIRERKECLCEEHCPNCGEVINNDW
jgi:hypothetical protein